MYRSGNCAIYQIRKRPVRIIKLFEKMINSSTNTLTQGLIDLIINLNINKSLNKHRLMSIFNSLKRLAVEESRTEIQYLFKELNGKYPSSRKQYHTVCLTFKLIDNDTNMTLSTETWVIEKSISSSKRLEEKEEDMLNTLQLLLLDIVASSELLSNQSSANRYQEHNNCSIVYQINTVAPSDQETKRNIVEIHSNILDTLFMIQHSTLSCFDDLQNDIKMMKKSSRTAASISEEKEEVRQRKVSFHSYYDQENDVTLLSNSSLSLEDENIEDVMCDEQEEQFEFEIVITEEDQRTKTFMETLEELKGAEFEF